LQHQPHPTAGSVPLLASPLRLVTSPASIRLPPPLLGQHSEQVLGEWLGYEAAAVQSLRQEGVV
jgi:crotonobetainyl-CoA:carnitine CoA-transferase CaiB-like acyl-CoA transferase